MKKPKLIAIVGPTASGKTDLSVFLARKFNGEIVSADSRQLYKGMDIGTGKVTKKEMQGIPHHILDIASPKRVFSAAHYKEKARQAIKGIHKRGKVPILVGGTGFYIQVLLKNINIPSVKPNRELRNKLKRESAASLFKTLESLDPVRAQNIDAKNKVRLVRAIEIATELGSVPKTRKQETFDTLYIGIKLPKEDLKKKIRRRLLTRVKQGMIAEVEKLHKDGVSWKRLEDLGLEYRYIAMHLQGKMTKAEMLAKLESEINKYAKRQMTWFRRNKKIHWVDSKKQAIKLVKEFLRQ